jgi:AraC family transcriptional regulator
MVACHQEITNGRRRRAADVGGYRLVEAVYPPGMLIEPHFHAASNLTIVLQGSLQERAGRGLFDCGPGSVVIKPAGTVHSNRFGTDGARTFVVELPAEERAGLDAEVACGLGRSAYGWRHGGPMAGALLRMLVSWRRGEQGPELIEEELVSLLPPAVPDGDLRQESACPRFLRRVYDLLVESFNEPVCLGDLAGAVGVHPVYLARAFRRHHGVTMTEFRHRLRVRAAATRLASSSAPLLEVALSLGFADQAHFCRSFKSRMGVTPGQFRRAVRG